MIFVACQTVQQNRQVGTQVTEERVLWNILKYERKIYRVVILLINDMFFLVKRYHSMVEGEDG
jgi:hypothetical protein